MTIDSDIFFWNYETGGDLAYYEGLAEVVLTVGLVAPKPGVFQPHIKFLPRKYIGSCCRIISKIKVREAELSFNQLNHFSDIHIMATRVSRDILKVIILFIEAPNQTCAYHSHC